MNKKEIKLHEQKHLNEVLKRIVVKEVELNKKLKEEEKKYNQVNIGHIYKKKLRDIDESKISPYFGRLDIEYEGEKGIKRVYIGKRGIDLDNENYTIYDWRAPIGTLYYKRVIGPAEIITTEKLGREIIEKANVYLIRNIDIEHGTVRDARDLASCDEKYADIYSQEHLIETLSNRSSIHLKEITATIQSQQYDIINDLTQIVIIQGCAGSGKSVIALQRVAYLIYRLGLEEKDILVIGPNKLFMNYIRTTLPELGYDNIKHITYEDFASELLGITLPSEDNIENTFFESNKMEEIIKFKGSTIFRDIIDAYMKQFIEKILPKYDLYIYGETWFSRKHLMETFISIGNYKLNESLDKMVEYIYEKSHEKLNDTISKIDRFYEEEVENLKQQIKDPKNAKSESLLLYEERDKIIKRLKRQTNLIVNDYINSFQHNFNAIDLYLQLVKNKEMLLKLSEGKLEEDVADLISKLAARALTRADIAGILYIYAYLNNIENNSYRHIVIDESQDISPFELLTLAEFGSSFTIIGDVYQCINSNNIFVDRTLRKTPKFVGKTKFFNLNTSYRNTYEIVMFAREIIKTGNYEEEYLPKPIDRHGTKPLIIKRDSYRDIINEIINLLSNVEGEKNIAIILKNKDKCKVFHKFLKDKLNINLITKKDDEYKGGINIMPAYLTKGLEFDEVIIPDADADTYKENDLDRNLLYIQVTRALHKLTIMYAGQISSLLKHCNSDFYITETAYHDNLVKLEIAKETLERIIQKKFRKLPEDIKRKITEEQDFENIQRLITNAAIVDKIEKIWD